MASFPSSPVNGQLFTLNNVSYKYSLTNKAWIKNNDSAYLAMSTYDRSIYKTLSTSITDKTIYDIDKNIEMRYFYNGIGNYIQNYGQVEASTNFPVSPLDGDEFIGSTGTVYAYDSANDYWKVVLEEFIKKYEVTQGSFVSEELNGTSLRFNRNNSDVYSLSIHQDSGMDTIEYNISYGGNSNSNSNEVILNTNEQVIIINPIDTKTHYILTIHLKHEGSGISCGIIRYGNVLFLTSFIKLISGDTSFESMTILERKLYKLDDRNDNKKKIVFDTDLNVKLYCIPKLGSISTFYQDVGQYEIDQFPVDNLVDGQSYISTQGNKYVYDQASDYWRCIYNAKAPNFATNGNSSNLGSEASLGSSNYVARIDHIHKFPIATEIGLGNVTNDSQVKRSEMGVANGVASLGLDGKVPSSQLNITSGLTYKGTWDASTNTPSIPIANSTNQNQFYIVNVGGNTTIGAISSWAVGDWIMSDGTQWSKVPSTQSIISVNGKTGTVVISKDDINLGNVQNVDQTNGSNITSGIISPSVLPKATTTTLGVMEVGNGLNVINGIVTPNLGTGLKLDIENKIIPDTSNIDVTTLKNANTLVLGTYAGTFNESATLSKFSDAKRGNFWIYNGIDNTTVLGITVRVGDQLWCNVNTIGIPSDIITNFSLVSSTVSKATTASYGTVIYGTDIPLVDVGTTGVVGVKDGVSRIDHAHPKATYTMNEIVTLTNTKNKYLRDDATWVVPDCVPQGYDSTKAYQKNTIVNNGGFLYYANADIPANTVWALGASGITWSYITKKPSVALSTTSNYTLLPNIIYEVTNTNLSGYTLTLQNGIYTGDEISILVASSGYNDTSTINIVGNINGTTSQKIIVNRSFVNLKFIWSQTNLQWIFVNAPTSF
jgi:hypothetical protein